jgi:hypothetical protein
MSTRAGIIDLNLLPASQRPAEVRGRAVVLAGLFLVTILALVPLAIHTHTLETRAADMERRAEQAQNHLGSLQLEFVQARGLRVEIDEATAQTAALTAERQSLQQGARPLHEDLSMLNGWGFLPAGARITRVTGEPNAFRVEGIANGPLDAIAYAAKLTEEGGFPSARMASFAPGAGGGTFTIEVAR